MIVVRMRIINQSGIIKKKGKQVHLPSRLIHATVLPELIFERDHEFKFDILDPAQWKKFLHNYRIKSTGEMLPRTTLEGNLIRYDVYVWGGIKGYKAPDGKNTCVSLFPGYDKSGKRLHPLEHGVID